MRLFAFCSIFFLLLLCLTGCHEFAVVRPVNDTIETTSDTSSVEAVVDVVKSLISANTASAPVNPWATPIGIGLVGISAMLEALRRKEKSARKYAEHKLNNGTNNNGA
jgi:hypothetical protein